MKKGKQRGSFWEVVEGAGGLRPGKGDLGGGTRDVGEFLMEQSSRGGDGWGAVGAMNEKCFWTQGIFPQLHQREKKGLLRGKGNCIFGPWFLAKLRLGAAGNPRGGGGDSGGCPERLMKKEGGGGENWGQGIRIVFRGKR